MKFIKRLKKTSEKIVLKTLSDCNSDIIDQLRFLRNLQTIRDNMYTNHEISAKEHNDWVAKQIHSRTEKFYAVVYDDIIAGGVSLNRIEFQNKRAEWAFYLSPTVQGKGIGASLEYKVLELVFEKMKLNKLDCEVLEFNQSVISMHTKFGFREEGRRRARIIRNGETCDAILLGITAADWQEMKIQ